MNNDWNNYMCGYISFKDNKYNTFEKYKNTIINNIQLWEQNTK